MKFRHIEINLLDILEKFKDKLPQEDYFEIKDLIFLHAEYGVGLETLCSQLVCYEISVPTSIGEEIIEIGRKMEIDEVYWKHLKIS